MLYDPRYNFCEWKFLSQVIEDIYVNELRGTRYVFQKFSKGISLFAEFKL